MSVMKYFKGRLPQDALLPIFWNLSPVIPDIWQGIPKDYGVAIYLKGIYEPRTFPKLSQNNVISDLVLWQGNTMKLAIVLT